MAWGQVPITVSSLQLLKQICFVTLGVFFFFFFLSISEPWSLPH